MSNLLSKNPRYHSIIIILILILIINNNNNKLIIIFYIITRVMIKVKLKEEKKLKMVRRKLATWSGVAKKSTQVAKGWNFQLSQ